MSNDVIHLDDNNFKTTIASGVTLVDFHAEWCGPCKMLAPIVEELAGELKGKVTIAKVDIDAAQTTTGELGISSVPTLILYKDGQEVQRVVGVRDKQSLKTLALSAV
jgi:thioredoxin 1